MSLRQIAGPFNLLKADGVTNFDLVPGPMVWQKGMGIIVQENIGGYPGAIATPDGICCPITFFNSHPNAALGGPGHWYYHDDLKTFVLENSSLKETVALCHVPFTSPYPDLPGFSAWMMGVIHQGKAVYLQDGSLYTALANGAGYSVTKSLFPSANWVGKTMAGPGRGDGEFFFSTAPSSDGLIRCCFYNSISQSIQGPEMFLGVNGLGAVYSPEMGVIISQHSTSGAAPWSFRVWSLDVVPTTLSNPVLQGGAVGSGSAATFAVTLTGDHGDPCVGWLVNWALTGSGNLLDTQTTTDATGTATCRVYYPVGATGTSTPTASVTC